MIIIVNSAWVLSEEVHSKVAVEAHGMLHGVVACIKMGREKATSTCSKVEREETFLRCLRIYFEVDLRSIRNSSISIRNS